MQEIGEQLFLFAFWAAFIGVLWMPITWLLLSIFTPQTLLDRYFKEPHFSLAETIMMKEFPGFLIRTSIFAWLTLAPSLDKKRGIKNITSYMPRWYSLALKIFMIGVLFTLSVMLILVPALLIMDFFTITFKQ